MNSSPMSATFAVSPLGKTHNVWLSIYLAILVGKFGEWFPGLASIPLAKIAFLLTALFAFRVRARLPTVIVRKLPIARPAIYFLTLGLISLVFTVYLGASVAMSYGVVITLLSVIILLKITQTIHDFERLLYGLTVAAAGLALATLFSYAGGRAQINNNFDPNDLAYGLVTILPIIRALAVTNTKRKLLLNGLAIATIVAVVLTGSRGGAVALCLEVLLVVAFPLSFSKSGEPKRFHLLRFIITIGAVISLSFATWNFLPVEIRQRAATLIDLQNDYNLSDSMDGRTEIWSRDIAAVWKRPIGYGLGTSEYVNGIAGGHYRAPHNTFIQAFVELGVLGVVLLALSYLLAITRLGEVSSRSSSTNALPNPKAALYARALRISVVANLAAGFFLSHAFDSLLWILIAICAALVRIEGATKVGPRPAAPA